MYYVFRKSLTFFKLTSVTNTDLPHIFLYNHSDIVSPIWVRLVSYNGANLLLSIPGTYFSARAAIAVYRHTGQFKSTKLSANDVTNSQGSTDSLAMTAEALGSRVNILDA